MAADQVLLANPLAQFRASEKEIRSAIDRVLESGWYFLGKEVKSFEEEFAAFLDASFCIGVGNGTDALALALASVGVGPADEVITVSHTAVATVAAIEQIGAVPVFADIDPLTRCMDPRHIRGLVSPATRAVVPVHIYGQPAPMTEILAIAAESGLKVVEDCAQAHGAELSARKVGTFGDAAAFSFYPTKNLGAIGDGGAVVTNDRDIAVKCRSLREYGWQERYISSNAGFNSRLDELQAAVLRTKLPQLEKNNERRREIASRYTESLAGTGITSPSAIPGTLHAMHLYVIEADCRDELRSHLNMLGIATACHYPAAVHQQPAYAGRIRGADNMPVTESLYRRILSLPLFPELADQEVDRVCAAIKGYKTEASPRGNK
jgi:dTDP-4-amino-4,6-dideoxygalactose transaminase